MFLKFALCVMLLLLYALAVRAQTDLEFVCDSDSIAVFSSQRDAEDSSQAVYSGLAWHDMFTRIPGDWGRFAGENFRVERIPAIAGIAAVTVGLMLADQQTWKATNNFSNQTATSKTITHSFALLGDGKTVLALAGSFALVGWTSKDNRALRTASQLVESYLASGIAIQVLKRIAGRERPEWQSEHRGLWRPFPNQKEYQRSVPKFDAFPSGHTASAMAMVTVLIENYPEAKWLKPLGYGIVGLVGFGLVSKGWHWYSDLPLAIALGYQYGTIAAHPDGFEIAKGNEPRATHLSLVPAFGSDGAGVMVSLQF